MPGGFGSGDQLAGFPDALTMRDPLAAIIARSSAGNFFELSNHLNLNAAANDQLEYIMNHPRKNMEEIKALLENIRPDEVRYILSLFLEHYLGGLRCIQVPGACTSQL